MRRTRLVIVGAGIAGLAAAHRAVTLGCTDVVVFEASGRAGGKISAIDLDGVSVDAGPDSFLTRNPAALRLCEELGLAADLVAPAAFGAHVWVRGALRPLPKDMALGVPSRMRSVAATGAVSPRGVARAALERFLPVQSPEGDVSVGRLIRARFGDEVFDSVVDPLLSGIYAGHGDRLSAEAVVPQMLEAVRGGRTLSSLKAPRAGAPAFLTVRRGLGRLVDALVAALPPDAIRIGAAATALEGGASRHTVTVESGEVIEAEGVVVATPPAVAATLLRSSSPAASALLASIDSAPIATVTMRFRPASVRLPDSTGFLVPRQEGRLLVGCTFVTRKWPHLAVGGTELVRCAVGRDGDARWLALDDEALVAALREELRLATGVAAAPDAVAIQRFTAGMPQYRVGHKTLIEDIDKEVAKLGSVAVAGAAYGGVGVPACIASGRRAAEIAMGARDRVAA